MLYRKFKLKTYYYFLKSINKLWIIPLIIINIMVPAVSFFLYKLKGTGAEIEILNVLYIFLPISTIWISAFVSESFFSEKTKDVLFFYNNKKQFSTSALFYLLPMLNASVIILLQFNHISDFLGMTIKIICISLFYYGVAMLFLLLSKSATMSILVLILYNLFNEFCFYDFFLFYKSYEALTISIFLVKYLPLILIGALFIIFVFADKNYFFKFKKQSGYLNKSGKNGQ